MGRARRVDANQPAMVKELRAILGDGAVRSMAHAGDGLPDIIVAHGGQSWLFEIKDPAQPPSARKLTDDEAKFHAAWLLAGGQVDVVLTTEDVLFAIGFGRDS